MTSPPAPAFESWARIDAWLAANAPASMARLRPGAEPAALAAAEQALGMPLPADLAASLACHDGSDPGSGVLPFRVDLLSAEGLAEQWELWNAVSTEFDEGEEPWGMIAGQRHWHRLWVPVTIFQGDLECLDMRPGPGQGRMGVVPHDAPANFDGSSAWPSLGTYLEAFADVLTTGRMPDPPPFDRPHATPTGELSWG
ncbi:hypothetical protein N566_09415 [Streptomycetaceae bacterium MP113-05]|nr:hypothetical protein N566_09415 [Streptomycetaceae bacterium MP113-05]